MGKSVDTHGLTVHYEDDYFGEPWKEPRVVLLVHGAGESGEAWFGWVAHLARAYRVIRMDLPGLGRSSMPPADFEWSPENFAAVVAGFMDKLGIAAAHVVSAKIGAAIAIQLAVSRPERLLSLSVVSGVIRKAGSGPPDRPGDTILEIGTRRWAEDSQRARLGSTATEGQIAWWNELMANSNPEACAGYANMMGRLDNYHLLSEIKVPTLFLGNERPGADQAASRIRDWQSQVPNSEATIFEAEGYHVAATEPDKCALRVLEFISSHR